MTTNTTPDAEFEALKHWPLESFDADPMRAVREQAERDDLAAEATRWDAEAAQRAATIRPAVNAAMDAVEASMRPTTDPFAQSDPITRWGMIRLRVWDFLAAPEGPGISKDADAGDFATTRWDRIKWRLWDRPKVRLRGARYTLAARPPRPRLAALLGGLLAATLVLILAWCGTAAAAPAVAIPAPPAYIAPRAAFYAAPVRLPSGAIDNARTVNAVRALGGSSYWYLLYPKAGHDSGRDWANLPAFLATAKRRGVSVVVVLGPPSSSSSSRRPCTSDRLAPFYGQYDRWMTEIGKLGRAHSNLIGVSVDDYVYNLKGYGRCAVFSPTSPLRWGKLLTAAAHRPLKAQPVLYVEDLLSRARGQNGRRLYAAGVRDIVHPWWPGRSGGKTLAQDAAAIRKAYPGMRVTLMVYVGGQYRGTPITAKVRASLATEAKRAGWPIVYYQHPLT